MILQIMFNSPHSGTNNIRRKLPEPPNRDSRDWKPTTKGFSHVTLSGIVCCGDEHNRQKTLEVNNELS